MKIYFDHAKLPTTQNFDSIEQVLNQIKTEVYNFNVTLTMDDRRSKRKTGPNRYPYVRTACDVAQEYVKVMPRDFEPADFADVLNAYDRLAGLQITLASIHEDISDTLMAAGIDCMTFARVVHAAIRNANKVNGDCAEALAKLDDFHAQSQKEETETPESNQATDTAESVAGG